MAKIQSDVKDIDVEHDKPLIYEDPTLGTHKIELSLDVPGYIKFPLVESSFNEKFRAIKWELLNLDKNLQESKTLLILSALPREGKSAVAYNLAVMLSLEINLSSILIDTSDGEDALTYQLGMEGMPGLNDYLVGKAELQDVVYRTTLEDCFFVPAGTTTTTRSELLASEKMVEFIEAMKRFHQPSYLIFDSKEVMNYADHKVLAPNVDRSLLIVQSGVTTQTQLDEVAHSIDKDKLVGIVMTQDIWTK